MVQDGVPPSQWHLPEKTPGTKGTPGTAAKSASWNYAVETVTQYLCVHVH
jgi:hypothetical protein